MQFLSRVAAFVLVLGMVATAHPAHAQTPAQGLFTEAAVPAEPRGAQARAADPAVAASVFARVDLSVLGGAGKPAAALDFQILRGLGATRFVARLQRTETQPSGRVAWIGTLDGVEFSSVTLIADTTEGTLTGSITYPGASFRIIHTGGGLHDIQKIDPMAFGKQDDVEQLSDVSGPAASAELSAANADSAARIDVLIVYSPAARAEAGGAAAIQSLIDLDMAQANQAYANSGITTRLRLVHTAEVAFTEGGLESDVQRLQGLSDGHADNVHALRDQVRADLVAIIVEEPIYVSCGRAAAIIQPALSEASKAFQATARGCLGNGLFILAHEFGHLMGARHDRYNDPIENEPFSYNHGYVSPLNNWHTVMAYRTACGGCSVVQYFSNPDLVLGGVPMGIPEGQANATDNRKTLNVMAPYVANFRQEAGGLPGAATLTSPQGTAGANPTYTWNVVTGATYYYLWVADAATGTPVVQQWFTAGAACSATACSVAQSQALTVGRSYHWWVQTWNPTGYGPWSTNATFTVSGSTAAATVLSLYGVPNTPVGGTARLWAHVQNTSVGLPSTARVWFYVSGPGWTGDNYVGSAGVADIAPGTSKWTMFDWTIEAGRTPGTYTYWARVFVGSEPISAWSSGQTFTVLAGNTAGSMTITSTYPLGTVVRGSTATLWAKVLNTGTNIPVGATVWFYVTGPSGQGAWVGGATLTGLAPFTEQWFYLQWAVPSNLQTGTYTYWAQAWSSSAAISAWSAGQPFSIQ